MKDGSRGGPQGVVANRRSNSFAEPWRAQRGVAALERSGRHCGGNGAMASTSTAALPCDRRSAADADGSIP